MAENLYCPRCAKPFTAQTSYCRTCGLALDDVSKIVTGEAAKAPEVRSRPNFVAFRLGLGLFILGMVLGLANGALKDLQLFPQVYGKMVFLAFIGAGLLCLGYSIVFPSKKYIKPKSKSSPSDASDRLHTSELSSDLLPSGRPAVDISFPKDARETVPAGPHSVTEHTTRNLN